MLKMSHTLIALELTYSKKNRQFIGNKSIITDIYRVQAYKSIMSGFFCILFIHFLFKGKGLLECTNLFSLNKYNKNDKIIFPVKSK